MIVTPKNAIDNGWISDLKDPVEQVHATSIDLTLDKLWEVNQSGTFALNKTDYALRSRSAITPIARRNTRYFFWQIDFSKCLFGASDINFNLPETVFGMIFTLPKPAANCVSITQTMIPAGHSGIFHFPFVVNGGTIRIEPGTPIASLLLFDVNTP